jgi:D-lactate dehydrogenase
MWAGNYTLSGLVGFEVRSKTIGVVGTGAIGAAACSIFLVSRTERKCRPPNNSTAAVNQPGTPVVKLEK